jgi:hypothetical protein
LRGAAEVFLLFPLNCAAKLVGYFEICNNFAKKITKKREEPEK